ncbi:serine hydrolase domain-containing protein [Saccharococcus caldoxylosilyticus]|uniref:serine hydrolase domain-containing protein n=1 Tax=Saccharococcus caldoxylosilyticus TaxID=81408 RepID=UPI0002D5BE9A|nr:serine hydrolase domain-containing protein [Parageobacillus caldoxylosilyticus]
MKTIISQLQSYMNRLEENSYFNGSILVGYKGDILLSRGCGWSNREHAVKNTPQTKYRIGSITKGFTVMAILQLQEQGLLSVLEPINNYLPDYPNGSQITIHHLLTHTSGIPDFVKFPDYWERIMRLPSTLDQTIDLFKNLPLEFTPGERFSYCTSSYILLTKIIELLSKQSYASFLNQYIFNPLKMNDTGVDNGRTIVNNLASGYSVWKEIIHTEHVDMSIPVGGYGLYSTVEDLYRWDQALYTNKLVSYKSLQSIFTPYQENYGYGWAIQQMKIGDSSHTYISHYGDINGFCGNMFRFVNDHLTVIVLSNLNITPVSWIGKNLASLFFGVPISFPELAASIDLNDSKVQRLIGTYQIENSERKLMITYEDGQLYVSVTKMHGAPFKYPIHPVSITKDYVRCQAEYVDETLLFNINQTSTLLMYREMGQTHLAFQLN